MDKKIMALVLIVCLVSVLCLWVITTITPGSTVQEIGSPSGEAKVSLTIREPQPKGGNALVAFTILEPKLDGGR